MNQDFLDMIYLFSCGIHGAKPMIDHDINIGEIYRYAAAQNAWHMVFSAICELNKSGKSNIDAEIFAAFRRKTFEAVALNANRAVIAHKLMDNFAKNGIKCCMFKGESLAHLYKNPDCRISSDTDILIDAALADKACKIAESMGFDIKIKHSESNHITIEHPICGVVELHTQLYKETISDVWFDNKAFCTEQYRTVTMSDGAEIPVLGITDGLLFTTLHCVKHFFTGGLGVRQISDVLLYMKHCRSTVDWQRFDDTIAHLKYKKFIDTLIGIGIDYMLFDKDDLPACDYDSAIAAEILDDTERGGIFGKRETGRVGSGDEYTKVRFERFKKGDSKEYLNKKNSKIIMRRLLPPKKTLELKYPYLSKSPFLYPVAWTHRTVKLAGGLLRKEKTLDRRMELIRKLDMI